MTGILYVIMTHFCNMDKQTKNNLGFHQRLWKNKKHTGIECFFMFPPKPGCVCSNQQEQFDIFSNLFLLLCYVRHLVMVTDHTW